MKKIVFFIVIIAAVANFMIGFNIKSDSSNFSLRQAEAAWFEFGEAAHEFEYDVNTTDCTATKYVYFKYGVQIDVSLEPPTISLGAGVTYERVSVPGKQAHCINGKKFQDCSDIIGVMNSILGDGDCVPKE